MSKLDYFEVSCMGWFGDHVWTACGGTPMTQSADRPQMAEKNRREIAKRIFDALCAKYPEKYIMLVQPQTPIPTSCSET